MDLTDIVLRLIVAIVPPLLLLIFTYVVDWKEREPIALLASLCLLGVVAFVAAYLWESLFYIILQYFRARDIVVRIIKAFLVVALGEEFFKFIFLKAGSWRNQSFNYRFDGIVYAVYVSLGFAVMENIIYVMNYGVRTALYRSVTSIPLHACCGVIMGIFYGYARGCLNAGNCKGKAKNFRLALLVPAIVHGFYDFSMQDNSRIMGCVWLAFTLLLFLIVVKQMMTYSVWDHPIKELSDYVTVYGEVEMRVRPDIDMSPSTKLMKERQRYDSYGQTQEISMLKENERTVSADKEEEST